MSIVNKVSAATKAEVERLADDYDARSIATGIGDESHRQLHRLSLWDGVEIAHEEIEKLQAFKDFVHKRLDDAGIPTHPEGEHSKAGCRIGDRLDIALNPWVPFSERSPDKTEEYLVGGGDGPVTVLTYDAEEKVWMMELGLPFPMPMQQGVHLTFTHWMPLPAPPRA